VVNHIGLVYILQDIDTLKLEDVHVTLLKAFRIDKESTDSVAVSKADKQLFTVEAIKSPEVEINAIIFSEMEGLWRE